MNIIGKVTFGRLRELLSYNPESGEFKWLSVRGGSRAGYFDRTGYLRIMIDRRAYLAHRLAWLYMAGKWPAHEIDHINCDKSNNCFANLREATRSENMANIGKQSANSSGLKGVTWHKRDRKWRAQIKIRGEVRHICYSDCPAAAHFAYIVAADKAHGEYARYH